ncbi:probable ATP-dependent DNA helicase RecS [Clytia hemisphaerica]|uniref:probable ATP-dependent DNA helicase RecS n=1 Tax=Clytia hemisphaerica TaxID=252671 RepID=UPI0034D74818
MASLVRDAVETCISRVNPAFSVKPKQLESIKNIINGHDTLAILPTSYGKSMIYQLLPSVCKMLPGQPDQAIIVVFSPLKALIQNQIEEANNYLESLNLRACSLDGNYQDIVSGRFNLIIDTPEAWLNNSRWKDMLSSSHFRKNVKCFVVDEAHKVAWGTPSSKDGEAFREAFGRIGTVRSFCSEKIPVLALSATVDRDYTQLIKVSCSLSSTLKYVFSCSDRPNLRLSFVKMKEKSIKCFAWVFNWLIEHAINCPKILIYCYSQELTGWLFQQFLAELGMNAFKDGVDSNQNLLIGMYHADTSDFNKQKAMDCLTKGTGNVRVIIATSALGCGVNCKDLSYVLHFGPAHGLVEYCQQIGRAGRSGEDISHAILYSYPQGSTVIAKQMRDYIRDGNDSCLRTKLFTPFNENTNTVSSISPAHRCCSFCSKSCACGADDCCQLFLFEDLQKFNQEPSDFKIVIREVSEDDKFNLSDLLRNFHNNFDDSLRTVPSAFLSGLTTPILKKIIEDLCYIDSPQYLLNTYIADEIWAQRIYDVIQNYFESGPSLPKKSKVDLTETVELKYEFTDSSEQSSDNDYDDENL